MTILGRHIMLPNTGQTRIFAARGTAAAAGNWWDVAGVTCIAAYRAKGAASYAASLVNLANAGTYDAYEGASPSWDAGVGWTFAGASYLYINSFPYVALDWTILVRATIAGNSYVIFSALNDAEARAILLNGSATLVVQVGASSVQSLMAEGDPPYTNAVCGVAGVQGYMNGSAVNTITGAGAITSTRACIGANWPGYGPYNPFTGTIMAVAIWSSVLSEAQVGAVTSAMAAL